jgi:hypothetical protein
MYFSSTTCLWLTYLSSPLQSQRWLWASKPTAESHHLCEVLVWDGSLHKFWIYGWHVWLWWPTTGLHPFVTCWIAQLSLIFTSMSS